MQERQLEKEWKQPQQRPQQMMIDEEGYHVYLLFTKMDLVKQEILLCLMHQQLVVEDLVL